MKRWVGVGVAVAVVVLAVVYFVVDPAEARWMPKCAFFQLTGWECAGCGSQRAFHALMHGDFGEAWNRNAFMILMLPVLGFLTWLEFRRKSCPELYRKVHTPLNILLFGIVILGWTIGRNVL